MVLINPHLSEIMGVLITCLILPITILGKPINCLSRIYSRSLPKVILIWLNKKIPTPSGKIHQNSRLPTDPTPHNHMHMTLRKRLKLKINKICRNPFLWKIRRKVTTSQAGLNLQIRTAQPCKTPMALLSWSKCWEIWSPTLNSLILMCQLRRSKTNPSLTTRKKIIQFWMSTKTTI